MKKALYFLFAIFVLAGCQRESLREVLIEKNLSAVRSELSPAIDTLIRDFSMYAGDKEQYEIPMHLVWVIAVDSLRQRDMMELTHHVIWYRLERLGGLKSVKIDNVRERVYEGANYFREDYTWTNISDLKGWVLADIKAPFRSIGIGSEIVRFNGLGEIELPKRFYEIKE